MAMGGGNILGQVTGAISQATQAANQIMDTAQKIGNSITSMQDQASGTT